MITDHHIVNAAAALPTITSYFIHSFTQAGLEKTLGAQYMIDVTYHG